MICCGVVEFDGMNNSEFTPAGAMAALAEYGRFRDTAKIREGDNFAHCVFSVASGYAHGKGHYANNMVKLKRYINTHKLGVLHTSTDRENPNSGNQVRAGLFTPNLKGMASWMKKYSIEAEGERREEEYHDWYGDRW